ncbi:stage V sporulation protein E [Thermoanaerobacterium sp. DL9XJH110]|uniref:stage V sporulation protein E n=1 Tax=Thermoanaerobacterium sp. DL9XJH110 TaxID=3386643 RepID=UPI003BB60434
MKYKKPPDFAILFSTLILLCFGIIMVFSSSSVWALYQHKDSFYFLKRQMAWAFLGFLAMIFFMNYDYWNIKRHEKTVVFVMFVLLAIVLIPGIGIEINYARRWIGVGSLTVQPSELAKLGMVIYLACGLERKQDKITNFFSGVVPFLIVTGIVCGLILVEPHLSAAVLIGLNTMIMLFVAGSSILQLLALGAGGFAGVVAAILSAPYRMRRFLSFLNPWEDIRDTGYHIIQSLYALGSGGLIGVGLGHSRQKFFYLPEPQTDFIFAIIGEELGFLGASFVMLLFMFFIWRGYKTALSAPDLFGRFLAAGLTTLIALQFLINIAVVTASMPVTGMPLPFISYGGSSLTITMTEVGILLNISRYTEAK